MFSRAGDSCFDKMFDRFFLFFIFLLKSNQFFQNDSGRIYRKDMNFGYLESFPLALPAASLPRRASMPSWLPRAARTAALREKSWRVRAEDCTVTMETDCFCFLLSFDKYS